jgi:hypothetical protein
MCLFLSHCTVGIVSSQPYSVLRGWNISRGCLTLSRDGDSIGCGQFQHQTSSRRAFYSSFISLPFTFGLCRWNTMFTDRLTAGTAESGPLIQVLCLGSCAIATLRLLNRVPRSKQQWQACHETLMALFEIYGPAWGFLWSVSNVTMPDRYPVSAAPPYFIPLRMNRLFPELVLTLIHHYFPIVSLLFSYYTLFQTRPPESRYC